jgi:hypothetical protein
MLAQNVPDGRHRLTPRGRTVWASLSYWGDTYSINVGLLVQRTPLEYPLCSAERGRLTQNVLYPEWIVKVIMFERVGQVTPQYPGGVKKPPTANQGFAFS